jgi:tRNA(Arg) A34 adenosine deaminase TadA
MRKSIQYFFDLAIKIAYSKNDGRSFRVGSIGIRKDGVIVGAPNAPCPTPERKAHAEYRVSSKLDYGATLYVARVLRQDGSAAIARPCPNCQRVLISKNVKKVYYTISPNEYGIWFPDGNVDSYYKINANDI